MKRILVIGLALGLTTGAAYAQDSLSGSEANVQITQQPQVVNISGSNATLKWQTNGTAANNVLYRQVGTSEWKHAFEAQGSKDHSVQLAGLQPSTKYEYQILTTSNKVRSAGQFDTPAAGAATTASTTSSTAATATSSGDRVPLYRAVNPTNQTHAYVTDQSQMPAGFTPEGTVGYLLKDQAPGTEAVYRLTLPATGDNFYTIDTRERDSAVGMGYQNQGVVGYAATSHSNISGKQPLYRLMLNSNKTHFYTNSPTERTNLLHNSNGAWTDEGIGFYVFQ
jgi:hypothetical protein